MPERIVIIGNGIAGITCARHIRKRANHAITVISSETKYFYSRTALMYIYMGHMKYEHTKPYEDFFWAKNRIELLEAAVASIDAAEKIVNTSTGQIIPFDKLVLATGSVSNMPGFKGVNLPGVQSLYGIPDLEKMETQTKHVQAAVIVGGGLIGIEMAEMLASRKIKVTFLVREESYWDNVLPAEESAMISRHIRDHHIQLLTSTELDEIKPGPDGRVGAVVTKDGKEIPCQFVGVAVGVSPNLKCLQNSGIETDKGILVNEFFETNMPGVYAIGDCVQHKNPPAGRKAVEQVWYTGRIHGETLAMTLCNKKTAYNPSFWFNSAKFLDIEYQTYGQVETSLKDDEEFVYWQHESENICFRAVYKKDNKQLVGINVLGMRLRHERCDQWLHEKKTIDFVMENLKELNFDPEFFDRHEQNIMDAYNRKGSKSKQNINLLAAR